MHGSWIHDGAGGKAGKFVLVAGLHVLVAVGVMHVMNAKTISLPAIFDEPMVWTTPEIPPPSPPEPPKPQVRSAPPDIVVPKVEVEIVTPPPQPAVQASTEPAPEPAPPLQTQAPTAPAIQPSTSNALVRSAVLADANGCAKPDYPMRAARNGDTGTVTLALLVGADGRVQDARIESSSGSRDLDRAAINALSRCTFQPAMHGGVAEAGWAKLAYVWTLE